MAFYCRENWRPFSVLFLVDWNQRREIENWRGEALFFFTEKVHTFCEKPYHSPQLNGVSCPILFRFIESSPAISINSTNNNINQGDSIGGVRFHRILKKSIISLEALDIFPLTKGKEGNWWASSLLVDESPLCHSWYCCSLLDSRAEGVKNQLMMSIVEEQF